MHFIKMLINSIISLALGANFPTCGNVVDKWLKKYSVNHFSKTFYFSAYIYSLDEERKCNIIEYTTLSQRTLFTKCTGESVDKF